MFDKSDPYHPVFEYEFDPLKNKTGAIWHCFLSAGSLHNANSYAYRIDGPPTPGNRFDFQKVLLDPWAKAVFFPPDFSRSASTGNFDNMGQAPLGQLFRDTATAGSMQQRTKPKHDHDWIVYEMHVKGFTADASSGVSEAHRGTFSGVIEKIPYLLDLGVTAVELMPVQQFDIKENNYWGYMTLNFFAPHNLYCVSKDGAEQIAEFRRMVEALHDAGIEVILDVIYNHTSEGGSNGPFFSYKGIDNASYYLLQADLTTYNNDAGTGNVLQASSKIVRKLILDSLRYWAHNMGVDGFRFDLASIFTRNNDGSINLTNPPLLEEISMDPALADVWLVAEPWDIASYQLGTRFPGTSWNQWNGLFRDDIRRFVKSDNGMVPAAMQRVYGSNDLFPPGLPFSSHPWQSINFITAHDGFSLYDLVSYNQKHNLANGENNRDGADENFSWNGGTEGDENATEEIMRLRQKQAKNFLTLLFLSNGIPMLRMGDEFLHTQGGNNNAYNQDNETNWLNWNRKNKFAGFYRFVKTLIAFRKSHPSLCRFAYWDGDVQWFGVSREVDYSDTSHTFAFYLDGKRLNDSDVYVLVNAYWQPLNFELQVGEAGEWKRVIDTALNAPEDARDFANGATLQTKIYAADSRSVVVLERRRT